MSGVRLSARSVVPPACSPPWTAYEGGLGDPQVWVACMNNSPGEAVQYTNFAGFVDADQCSNPVLSPDGTKVLFDVLGVSSGLTEVWVVDATPGSTPVQLVADASNYILHPAWGPDSDTFLYVHGAGGSTAGGTIYKDTVSAPGSPVALKAASGGFSPYRPQFNFDGSRIAYIWDKDVGTGSASDGDLRCMDDDGTNDGSLDNTIGGYFFNQPTQFSWANTQSLIAYVNIFSAPFKAYVIDDTGSGKTQINANGDGAGFSAVISRYAWPADDSFVIFTSDLGVASYWSVMRGELDGSNSTELSSTRGAVSQGWFEAALVYGGRAWFVSSTEFSASKGVISSMLLDGSDERDDFDSSAGAGTMVGAFSPGDGWYQS